MDKFKGFVVFYVKADLVAEGSPFAGQDVLKVLGMVQEHNKELVHILKEQGYACMFVPVNQESCHVEKIDIDLPYPRYVLPHVDIAMNDKMYDEILNKVKAEGTNG